MIMTKRDSPRRPFFRGLSAILIFHRTFDEGGSREADSRASCIIPRYQGNSKYSRRFQVICAFVRIRGIARDINDSKSRGIQRTIRTPRRTFSRSSLSYLFLILHIYSRFFTHFYANSAALRTLHNYVNNDNDLARLAALIYIYIH